MGLRAYIDYCRPRVLILSTLLSVFAYFNFLYWLQYVSSFSNISAILFCIGSILSLIGNSMLFTLHSIPFLNLKAKQTGALFILFGAIIWFIASCFELSIDNHHCGNYYFCEIHVFAYILLPFGTTIMLCMDELFDHYFYFNQRVRVCTYSLLLLLSAALFIPYYLELDTLLHRNTTSTSTESAAFHAYQSQLEEASNIKLFSVKVYVETVFVVIWSAIALAAALMILCIGVCRLHQQAKGHGLKNVVSWISSILLFAGSGILVISYLVQNDDDHRKRGNFIHAAINRDKLDIDDPVICYHFLVCAECWILAVDALSRSNRGKLTQRELRYFDEDYDDEVVSLSEQVADYEEYEKV